MKSGGLHFWKKIYHLNILGWTQGLPQITETFECALHLRRTVGWYYLSIPLRVLVNGNMQNSHQNDFVLNSNYQISSAFQFIFPLKNQTMLKFLCMQSWDKWQYQTIPHTLLQFTNYFDLILVFLPFKLISFILSRVKCKVEQQWETPRKTLTTQKQNPLLWPEQGLSPYHRWTDKVGIWLQLKDNFL